MPYVHSYTSLPASWEQPDGVGKLGWNSPWHTLLQFAADKWHHELPSGVQPHAPPHVQQPVGSVGDGVGANVNILPSIIAAWMPYVHSYTSLPASWEQPDGVGKMGSNSPWHTLLQFAADKWHHEL